jgi:uncharacterized DUF497 family protein
MIRIEFDLGKDEANRRKHGLTLSRVQEGDWAHAYIEHDDRRDYGELRFYAYLVIEARVHVVIFTPRGDRLRIISLRRANSREVKRYEQLRPAEPRS